MSLKQPTVYLANFQLFMPNGKELAQKAVKLCEQYGFKAFSPVLFNNLEDISSCSDRQRAAKDMFKANIENINACDVLIADLNCFRGWEPHSGTCFELGYAYTKGKKLYAYMEDTRPCYEKYIGSIHYDGVFWRDDNGAFFESGCCNLMMSSPAQVIEGTLEHALAKAKKDFDADPQSFLSHGEAVMPKQIHHDKPYAYLAGTEIFYPNSEEKQAQYHELCNRYNIVGLYPSDQALDDEFKDYIPKDNSVSEMEKTFFTHDANHVRRSDMIIANLNNYRGDDADSGTVVECALAYGWGKKCFGYLEDARPMSERFKGVKKTDDKGMLTDVNGYYIEDFGLPLNFMLNSMFTIVEGGLEQALKEVAKQL